MVETIAPVVHGGRKRPYYATVGLHTLGATLTAALAGMLFGALGMALGAPWGSLGIGIVVAVSVVYGVREILGLPIPLPERRAQVPDWWRTFYSPATTALMYGAGLGAGFLTYLTYGTYVTVAALAVVSGDPLVGAVLCAPFGLARGLSVLVGRRTRDTGMLVERLNDVAVTKRPSMVNGLTMLAVAGAGLIALF
jgi:hypothetical protein